MPRFCRPAALFVLAALLGVGPVADAQIWNRARRAVERGAERAVERQVENRTRQAAEAAINAMFDAGEDAVRCVFSDTACIERAQAGGSDVVLTDADGAPVDRRGRPVTEANAADAVVRSPGASVGAVDANYDFEPGERVLFADDFSGENVGDFPRTLHYLAGTHEVVAQGARRFLRSTASGPFQIRLDRPLPETFTLEFDVQLQNAAGVDVYFAPPARDDDARPFYGYEGAYLNVGSWRGSGLWVDEEPRSVKPIERDVVLPIRVSVDGGYVKMYVGTERVANVPRAELGRHDAVTFVMNSRNDRVAHFGNVRLAAGGNEYYDAGLYETLSSQGRVVTEGVYFDTASATLKPESFAVVQEIAEMLREHPDLRVRIEGHTDDEGDPAANQTLSEARANAVRAMLVGLGIDAGRLEAAGLGQTQPVAPNDTAEGRAQNRRVELVRL